VWDNPEVASVFSFHLSTKTGLLCTVATKHDDENDLYAYYWTALGFRTGRVVWQKLAGTGMDYDGFYPGLAIGPDQVLYVGGYGGMKALKATP
jgi:hypothetical protein